MLKHFLWDYFKESGDLEAYVIYKEIERLDCSAAYTETLDFDLDWNLTNDI